MPGMTPKDESFQNTAMSRIEDVVHGHISRISSMDEDSLSRFMAFDLLNELMSDLPTKKIGNAQRDFFKTCFKVLIETEDLEGMQVVWQAY